MVMAAMAITATERRRMKLIMKYKSQKPLQTIMTTVAMSIKIKDSQGD
jgi:hypothetical protein